MPAPATLLPVNARPLPGGVSPIGVLVRQVPDGSHLDELVSQVQAARAARVGV